MLSGTNKPFSNGVKFPIEKHEYLPVHPNFEFYTALPSYWLMFTIVEASLFSPLVSDDLSEEEYEDLKLFFALNPESGDVIPGSGGLRKLRWIRTGTGKRGGVRVIYFLRTSRGEVALLTLYAKSRVGNLPPHIARQLKEVFENGQI
ncbi:MAG: hypothetical protein ACYCRD_04150 [Leptospirillum sp.]